MRYNMLSVLATNTEEALMVSSDDQRSAPIENLEAIEYPSFAIDEAFNIVAINAEATRLFKIAGSVTGRNLVDVLRTVSEKPFDGDRERRFRQLSLMTDNIPALASYIGADERFKFVNARHSEWFGLPKEEVVGKEVRTIYGRSAYEEIRPRISSVLKGDTVSFETQIRLEEGEPIFINASFVPDIDDLGNVRGFYCLISDVTKLKRSELLLRLTEDRVRMITDSFTDYAILSMDTDLKIDSWNPGGVNIFGYEEHEILGKAFDILFTPEDVSNEVPLKETIRARTNGRASDERWHLRKDGVRFFASGVIAPLYFGGELKGYAKIVSDLTERNRHSEELQSAYDQMEIRVSERTKELADTNTELVAAITDRKTAESIRIDLLQRLITGQEDERRRIARDIHDQLGQRLTALRLKIASLREMCAENPELHARATRLQEIAEMLDSEVSFLAWQLRPTALDELGLSDAVNTYVKEWSRHYGIPARFHPAGLAALKLDRDLETHLYRITQEALHNVVKHADAAEVNVLLERSGENIVLIVEDNGVGFSGVEKERVPKSRKGLGIKGMNERAVLIGGSLEIESAPGSGTTVYIRAPLQVRTDEENKKDD